MSSRRRSRRRRRSSTFRSRNSPKLFDYFVVVGLQQTNFNAPTNKTFSPSSKDIGWEPTVQYSYNSNKIISGQTTSISTTATSSGGSSPIPKLQERYSKLHVDKESAKEELELMDQITKFSFCDLSDLVNKYNALSEKDKEHHKYYKILSFKHGLQCEKFTFCVTKSTGQRLYGHCRRVFTPDVNLKPSEMPTALVLISSHRFHILFDQIMDHIVARWLICHQAIFPILDALILNQPPALGDTFRVTIKSQVSKEDEVLTFKLNSTYHVSLKTLFQTLSVDNILWLISCVLTERRIIFYCNSLEVLSECIHGIHALIYPFRWQHIFVPVLPESLLNYLAAPMPFIIGIKSYLAHSKTEFEISEVVLVDLDKQSVRSTNELQDKLRPLPSDPSWKLKRELKKNLKKYALSMQTPEDYRQKYGNYNYKKAINIPKLSVNMDEIAKGWDDLAFYDAFLAFFVLFIGDWRNFYDETNRNVPKPPYHLSSETAAVNINTPGDNGNSPNDSSNSLKQSVTAASHTPPAHDLEYNDKNNDPGKTENVTDDTNKKFGMKNIRKFAGAKVKKVGGMAAMAGDKLKKKLRDEARRREVTKDKKMYYNGEALEYIELLCQSQLFQTWFVRQQKETEDSINKMRGIQDRYDYVMANFNRIGASYTGCYKYLCLDSKYRNANNHIHGNLKQIVELTASFTSNRDYTALMQQQKSIQLTLNKLGQEATKPMGFNAIINIILFRLNDCFGKNNHPHGLMALYLLANLIENSSDRVLIQAINKYVFYANVLEKYQHEKIMIQKQMNKIAHEVVKISTKLEEIKKLKIEKYVAFGDDYEYKYDENKLNIDIKNGGIKSAFIDDKIAEIDFGNIANNIKDQNLLGNFLHSNTNNSASELFTEISQFRVDNIQHYRQRCLKGEVRMIPPFEHLRNQFAQQMPDDLLNSDQDDILAFFSDGDDDNMDDNQLKKNQNKINNNNTERISEKASEFAMNVLNSFSPISTKPPNVDNNQLSIFDLGSNDINTQMPSNGSLLSNNDDTNNDNDNDPFSDDSNGGGFLTRTDTKRDHNQQIQNEFNRDWVQFDADNNDGFDGGDDNDDESSDLFKHFDNQKSIDVIMFSNVEKTAVPKKKKSIIKGGIVNVFNKAKETGNKAKKKGKKLMKNSRRKSNDIFGIDDVQPIVDDHNKHTPSKDFDALTFDGNIKAKQLKKSNFNKPPPQRHNNVHKADKNNSKAASLFDDFDFTQDDNNNNNNNNVKEQPQTQEKQPQTEEKQPETKHKNTDTFDDLFGDFSNNNNGNNNNLNEQLMPQKQSVKQLMQNAYNNKSHNHPQAKRQSTKASDLFGDLFD